MDAPDVLRDLLDHQSGVVARRQLVSLGMTDNDIRRSIRRRDLARVHQGVFVNHTGPLTWVNRAWAAVLFHDRAALCHESALNRAGDLIHVAIEHPRRGTALPGVRLHRLRDLERKVLWNASPPRLRIEEAALDLAAEAPLLADAVETLTAVCRRRSTTPNRLLDALSRRERLRRGRALRAVLADAAAGVQSVLERSYVVNVERRHALPVGKRQVRELTDLGIVYRDVVYEAFGVVVELDGVRWHDDASRRSADLERDLVVASDGRITIRLGWRQSEAHACRTAGRLAAVLQQRGWRGAPRPCGPSCSLPGRSQSPSA